MSRALTGLLLGVGRLLYGLGLARLVIAMRPRAVRVLAYHACEPEESDFTRGLRSNTTPDELRMHLRFLAKRYTVVSVDQAVGSTHRAPAVLTFDDGYASVYEHAFPELRARNMPATLYLVPDVVDNVGMVWVNELNAGLRRHPSETLAVVRRHFDPPSGGAPEAVIDHVRAHYDSEAVGRLLADLRETVGTDGGTLASEEELYLTWAQVDEMASGGVSFGCHTRTHPSLPRLDPEQQAAEIRESRDAVAARMGVCDSFAHPFGDADSGSRSVAGSSGFETIVELGVGGRPGDAHRIPRVATQARSEAELFAELEVVAPVKGWVARLVGKGD